MKYIIIFLLLLSFAGCSGGSGEQIGQLNNSYIQEQGKTYRVISEQEKVEVYRELYDDFEGENVGTLHDIIAQRPSDRYEKNWDSMTLQSPLVPTVTDYVALRKCILEKTCDFKDNYISIDTTIVYDGDKSLKFHAVEKSESMVTTKSSLQNNLLYYKKGDDIWISAMIYVDGSLPYSIMDLETSFKKESPGIRITINSDHLIRTELKSRHKWKTARLRSQPKVPVGKWFHLKVHYYLDETEKGLVQIWQNGIKIVDDNGPTIPSVDTIYDKLEIGISAHSFEGNSTVYFDNIHVADSEDKLQVDINK